MNDDRAFRFFTGIMVFVVDLCFVAIWTTTLSYDVFTQVVVGIVNLAIITALTYLWWAYA